MRRDIRLFFATLAPPEGRGRPGPGTTRACGFLFAWFLAADQAAVCLTLRFQKSARGRSADLLSDKSVIKCGFAGVKRKQGKNTKRGAFCLIACAKAASFTAFRKSSCQISPLLLRRAASSAPRFEQNRPRLGVRKPALGLAAKRAAHGLHDSPEPAYRGAVLIHVAGPERVQIRAFGRFALQNRERIGERFAGHALETFPLGGKRFNGAAGRLALPPAPNARDSGVKQEKGISGRHLSGSRGSRPQSGLLNTGRGTVWPYR